MSLPRAHLINAVVGRVAPRAPSRGLEKDWLSLRIGRLGARGATRPTIYEMASTVFLFAATGMLVVPAPGADSAVMPGGGGAQPPFTLRQTSSAWWLASPEGRRFFSVGVCLVTRGASRESFDRDKPSHASGPHYAQDPARADATLRRPRKWDLPTTRPRSHPRVAFPSSEN